MTDWNTWSRIVDAAQDPRHREAVQQYLGQAELSAELPAALYEELLAPRRSAGATGEQCANLLCNLGFAALVAGTRDAADFATGCGRQAKLLAPDSPDLTLRRHFLFAKSTLMIAVLTGQPHVLWDDAAERCAAYLSATDQFLEALPAEVIESNAMAACSFAAQLLSRIESNRAVRHYASEISQLVEVALGLADRLPAPFASRLWSSVIPGSDAGLLFRQAGAVARRVLQAGEDLSDHARRGIAYADEVLSTARDRSNPGLGLLMQTRAELLLLSGRYEQAMDQADALEKLSDGTCRKRAMIVKARHDLAQGAPESAVERLAQVSPTADQVVADWRATWMGDADAGHWTNNAGAVPEVDQEIWRLQAVAAAELDDFPALLGAAERSTGFLADSLLQDRQAWTDGSSRRAGVVPVEPKTALDEIFAELAAGTTLLQVVDTGAGILTWVAWQRDGEVTSFIAPGRPDPRSLTDPHRTWSRACFDYRQRDGAAADDKADCAAAFSRLMDEIGRNWGGLLQEFVADGTSRFVFIGDDLVDIPLHALRIGSGDERLIDLVPVTYVPSLFALRACVARKRIESDRRRGLALFSLAEPGSAEALAEVLGSEPRHTSAPYDAAFWAEAAAAEVLHVGARVSHVARMPLQSVLGAGWLDLSIAGLVAGLELPRCELVSSFACESALPSMLRAPGFDLATVFLAAGAGSVLTSTWFASDEVASAMTRLFFRRWVAGLAPSAAFREALREMRSEDSALEDFEWACMRLVGAP